MKGRKPDPAKLKLAATSAVRMPPAGGVPRKPPWLSARAAEEWERIVPVLIAEGVVCDLDTTLLAGYCEAFAMYRDALALITAEGLVVHGEKGSKQNPACGIAKDRLAEMRMISAEFGFSPQSRVRLAVPGTSEEEDAFGAWMKGPSDDAERTG